MSYDGEHYCVISEDEISHSVLTAVAKDAVLSKSKYKLRVHILKRIKEKTLWATVPESATIQHVLSFMVRSLFSTKEGAKYFLAVIGDGILSKKPESLVYFIDPSYKSVLQTVAYQTHLLTGKSIGDSIKVKYYDHDYNNCRLLAGVRGHKSMVEPILRSSALDLIAVSVHYSTRYRSAEGYLSKSSSTQLCSAARLLEQHTPETLLEHFMGEHTVASESDLSFKDLYFLWRHFLYDNSLPFVISQSNLKIALRKAGYLDVSEEVCPRLASRYPMYWVSFRQFWDETIVHGEDIDNSYEVGELVTIYNDWCGKSLSIQEAGLCELLQLEHPLVKVDNIQVILNVNCSVWDKTTTIREALEDYSAKGSGSRDCIDLYRYYCAYITEKYDGKYIVSKAYFDEFLETAQSLS